MASLKPTITQRRAKLTEEIKKARQEFINVENRVKYEVRKANPGLKEKDWVGFYKKVEADPRRIVAETRLLALCDAANIMGADID